MSRRAVWILLALLAAAPLHAQQPSGAPAIDGCALVSRDDIEAIIGEKLKRSPRKAGVAFPPVVSSGCNYSGPVFTVEVRLERGRTAEDAQGYMKTLRGVVKQTTQSDAKQIKGLGDDAWWGPISPTSGILTVIRKSDILWVQTYGKSGGAGSLEKTRAVMEKLLAAYEGLPKT